MREIVPGPLLAKPFQMPEVVFVDTSGSLHFDADDLIAPFGNDIDFPPIGGSPMKQTKIG